MKKNSTRTEIEIFKDLEVTANSPGYIHAFAILCLKNNIIYMEVEKGLNADALLSTYSKEKLIRTELAILHGLMVKSEINYSVPDEKKTIQKYIRDSESLLEELHAAILLPMREEIQSALKTSSINEKPKISGPVLREAIFYSADSAYDFQYRDMSPARYEKDEKWLKQNKGFSILEGMQIVEDICFLFFMRLNLSRESINSNEGLKFFEFKVEDVVNRSQIDLNTVISFINEFSQRSPSNLSYCSANDYNEAMVKPIIKVDDANFILFNSYDLRESLYDSPFYWMANIDEYKNLASKHRGEYTENFCNEKMMKIFGKEKVFPNVELRKNTKKVGEIDALVIYGNKAIVLQAKTKRLTLKSKQGNILKIQNDFKLSVEESYEQGLLCSKYILKNEDVTFYDKNNESISIVGVDEIYLLCVVSDHYPSLNYQVKEFLKVEDVKNISEPFVLDVFAFDAITEMLDTPLFFLSYIKRRLSYFAILMSSNEFSILSNHLCRNLWLEDKYSMVFFGDDMAVDLDVAMNVRRNHLPGNPLPEGILTYFKNGIFGKIIDQIQIRAKPQEIDLGMLILSLSGTAFDKLNKMIEHIVNVTKSDLQQHDVTFPIGDEGITIHSSFEQDYIALPFLHNHCTVRKYTERARQWYGVFLDPVTLEIKNTLILRETWKFDPLLEGKLQSSKSIIKDKGFKKIGRNDKCNCGSGIKFKYCCL